MGVSVGVLDHFNIRTRKLDDTVRFYEDFLGLEKGARPNFAFPGAWMYSEGKPVVHLVDIRPGAAACSGVVHRPSSKGFADMQQRLNPGVRIRPGRFRAASSGRSSSMTPMAS
jgi:catechol 2,3-dioxygenase-like lactoylglutathione lyase family enzyme